MTRAGKDRLAIEQQAATFVAALASAADARTHAALEQWLLADPAHAVAFARAEAAWDAGAFLAVPGGEHDAGRLGIDNRVSRKTSRP